MGTPLAAGPAQAAVGPPLPLLLRARDEPRFAIGALVHVDVAAGRGLRESGRRDAGERGGEAERTLHEGTKENRGARQIADITVYIVDAVKPARTRVLPRGTRFSAAGGNR